MIRIMGFNAWRARRLASRRQIECGLRVVEGDQPGLTARWRHGVATLSPGRIEFRRFLPPGIRVRQPFTTPVRVEVLSVSTASRSPGLRESWSVNPAAEVVFVNIEAGTIEWAIVSAQREWALAQVRATA